MATRERDADSTVAEAVTLAVDDVVLERLLDDVARTPTARERVIGVSVYRVPVDDVALIWQISQETEQPPDPDREARMTRVHAAIETARETPGSAQQLTAAELELTDDDIAAYQADIQALQQPPVTAPDTFPAGLAGARSAGLIAPVTRPDGSILHVVHRWTARALAQLEPRTGRRRAPPRRTLLALAFRARPTERG